MGKVLTKNNKIAKRLMIAVILSSTLITILTSAYQLYGLYSRDISAIDARMLEIEEVHVDSIATDLWNSDYGELAERVDSMINIPDMLFIEVREQDKSKIEAGTYHDDQVIQKKFELNYFYRGEERNIGDMLVQFDLNNVYQRLINQFIDILVSNSIKTFLISFFILWLFSRLVTRHIQELSSYASNLTSDQLTKNFIYSDKPMTSDSVDELDVLSDAFNKMKNNMHESMQALENSRKKIQESELFYESILDMNEAVVYVKDKDGRFIFVNRKCEQIFNIDRRSLLDKTSYDLFSGDESVVQVKNDQAVMKSRVPIEFVESLNVNEQKLIFLSLKFPLMNDKNETYALGCVSTDITKLIETQDNLEKKSIELEEVLNNLIDGVITINEDLSIADVNHAAEGILGYRKRELIGQEFSILMRDEDKPKFMMIKSTLAKLVSERMIGTNREFYAKRKNGEIFPLQLSINRLPESADGKKRFITSFIDTTEIKEKERLLRQSLKLEALGKLTGGIAHDYNNMLGVVQGYTELITLHNKNDEKLSEYIKQIAHACGRGAALTKKLLSFSSQQQSEAEVINVSGTVAEMHDMLEKTLTVRIKLIINKPEDDWFIYADKGELEDSVLNMSINAMHAMPDGGELIIDISNIKLDNVESSILGVDEGQYVRLSIIDSGSGMPEEVQRKIFDPFFTTKGDKGTGLGLSQVYGFTKKAGGNIQVKSTPGSGTRFTLYFPRHVQVQDVSEKNNHKIDSQPLNGSEKLLLVEDEPSLRMLGVELFKRHGYEVYAAANGLEAIPLLEKHTFSLVISDLLMPEMDGYKLASYIRKTYPSTRIQILSGFNDEKAGNFLPEDLKEMILKKPISSKSLLSRVRTLLDS